MSSRPTVPDSGLQHLVDDGYEVEVRQQHLLVHSIPYVTALKQVKRGTLVCKYVTNGTSVLPPAPPGDSHQVWWAGEYPCFADGRPMSQLENEHNVQELFPGCTIQHRFSNKPFGVSGFGDHYQKVTHYVRLIQAQANALTPGADARTGQIIEADEGRSALRYADSASARAEILATSERLAIDRLAIVGLGGTGSYVLDQIAKTPVRQVHLFDGDVFRQHNAFRTPGAATREEIEAQLPKTEYLRRRYDAMHSGIVSHPYYLDASNITELDGFAFVFVCVDRGAARRLVHEYLHSAGIPFIDVGMNLQVVPGSGKLVGTCRATLCTHQYSEHLARCIPTDDDDDDALYRHNVQVADMNALNAQLAVIKWKQHFGFYADDFQPHHLLYSPNSASLARSELTACVSG